MNVSFGIPSTFRISAALVFIVTFWLCVEGHNSSFAFADSKTPGPAIADAAEQQAWDRLEKLKSDGADINDVQRDGMSALHWAVWYDHASMVAWLLKNGARADAPNRYEVRPLAIACQNGNDEIVRLLLDAGADPHATRRGGETPLMTASRTGNLSIVDRLIRAGAHVNDCDVKNQTALMWAADEGHASVVKRLIEADADFDKPLSSGFTPLMFAARDGQLEVVKVLVDAGAKVDQAIDAGKPASRGPREGTSALILAIENGHFELADYLVQSGADPNDQRTGYAPLHMLTWVRKPNRGDGEDGDPPPTGSGLMSSLEFARAIVKRGANVNLQLTKGSGGKGQLNKKGATPFLLAAFTEDLPYLKLLMELGADPFLTNVDGTTPMMAAAGIGVLAPGEEAGTEEEALLVAQYLIAHGAKLDTVDANGETVMHGAAYKSLPKMVDFLVRHGADQTIWNRENKHGWSPLEIAEGYRPGNFKPAPDTQAAIKRALAAPPRASAKNPSTE